MANWEEAKADYEAGLTYKSIAEKYNVSISAVKSWAQRHWVNDKVATKKRKKVQPRKKKDATGNPKGGAQYNNLNAAGAHFQNALKHGGYSAVLLDNLSDEEKKLLEDMDLSAEALLVEEIQIATIREYRLLKAIKQMQQAALQNSGLVVSNVVEHQDKRRFKDDKEKAQYEAIKERKVAAGQRLPGDPYNQTVTTENVESALQRLNAELTKVQKHKQNAIRQLTEPYNNTTLHSSSATVDEWIAAVQEAENGA